MSTNLNILTQELEGLELDLTILYKLKNSDPDISKVLPPIINSIQKRLNIISVCYLDSYNKFSSLTFKSSSGNKKLDKDSLFSELFTNLILKVILKLASIGTEDLQSCFMLFDRVSNRETGIITNINNILDLVSTIKIERKLDEKS